MTKRPADPSGPDPLSTSGMNRRLLSRRNLWICVALSVVIFLFWEGRGFRQSTGADAAALYSYAFIPPLVLIALVWERNVRPIPVMLAVIEVTAWKFLITYGIAQTVWFVWPPVTSHAVVAPPSAPREPDPLPSVIDPATTGTIEGQLTSSSGGPINDVIVYVDAGLDRFVFAPPSDVLRVLEGKGTIEMTAGVGQWGQAIEARSVDGQLHTLIASASEGDAFSIPLQSSGAWSRARLGAVTGLATLHCAVHPGSGEKARLLITANPFFVKSDERGAFRLLVVPAARLRLSALGASATKGSVEATVEAGKTTQVALSL